MSDKNLFKSLIKVINLRKPGTKIHQIWTIHLRIMNDFIFPFLAILSYLETSSTTFFKFFSCYWSKILYFYHLNFKRTLWWRSYGKIRFQKIPLQRLKQLWKIVPILMGHPVISISTKIFFKLNLGWFCSIYRWNLHSTHYNPKSGKFICLFVNPLCGAIDAKIH